MTVNDKNFKKKLIAPFLSYSFFLRGLFFYAAPCRLELKLLMLHVELRPGAEQRRRRHSPQSRLRSLSDYVRVEFCSAHTLCALSPLVETTLDVTCDF